MSSVSQKQIVGFDRSGMKKRFGDVVNNVDALHEIFSHLDADALAMASCVSRQWYEAAMDDNMWEEICTKHWPSSTGISMTQLRYVVNVMGGFRRLYAKCLHPLLRRPSSSSSYAFKEDGVVWSEDQVQLSLCLFSVDYYKRLGSCNTLERFLVHSVELHESKI
ncbi:hypothetical protein SUGI_1489850 [Cryptomeria japonica]|uniref:F-box domain-containing protein n=1 Tax=Cryptomeria japonica TaxID=3369 RepID=A0AAD3RRL6_CRYJA|nr:hypothetical protein SUGI_1435030 [Cryptomeria japonica]GLJ59050.1 hypothetical protein SUGI_1489850 [Cryptomeria japonica]